MDSLALFQILYQQETLFRLENTAAPKALVPEPKVAVNEPVIATKPALAQTPAVPIAPVSPVIIPKVPEVLPVAKTIDFPPLAHQILILIDEHDQPEMTASEALFLDNILKAVGHSTQQSDILNFSYIPGQDARKVLSEKKTNFFITFGVPLIKLHLDLLLAPYTPKFVDGIWFLLTDPLAVIEADRDLKKKLWQGLKKMFEMS